MKGAAFFALILSTLAGVAQDSFPYSIQLEPVSIPGLPGLHSYAFAQHENKWLILGGRTDGLHARQPFSSFPQSQNNTTIYVIDVHARQYWTASVLGLDAGLREQLQSSNMNFFQDADTLVIIGGYGFSATANNHRTYPNLTVVRVSGLIQAIVNGTPIQPFFRQITDENFAVTGGQLGKIGNQFYLVGGHRFDGRYNAGGGPTFTQTYTNQIRKFSLNNAGNQPVYFNYSALTDPVHLHRRDYNLLPQIFPDRAEGYTLSSGVFQPTADLPFLYPVDIRESGYTPVTGFNQYLSNYHSARTSLYDSVNHVMHNLFFGGISQYYYQSGTLVQDPLVPFVRSISRVSRAADGTLREYLQPEQMPGFEGASAEFIPNRSLPHYSSEIIKLSRITENSFVIGHILGGIRSPVLNPFAANQTTQTSASALIYSVRLNYSPPTSLTPLNGSNPYRMQVYPNPVSTSFVIKLELLQRARVEYLLTNSAGQLIRRQRLENTAAGINLFPVHLQEPFSGQTLFLTVIINNRFFLTEKLLTGP